MPIRPIAGFLFASLAATISVALGVLGATPAWAALPGASSVLTRAPYLSDLTQTSVQVSWGTSAQYTGVVEYGPPGNCTSNSVISTKMGNPITINGVTEYQNSVLVTGLSPDTTYCYRITNTGASPVDLLGSNLSPQFTTMETAGGTQPLTFDVLGDWGDTTDSGVNDGSLNANQAGVDAQIAASGAQFAISVGDVAYQGGTQTDYGDLNQTGPDISAVFGPSYWAVPGESIPLLQVDGNHGQNVTSLTNWPEGVSAASSAGGYSMVSYPSSLDGITPGSYPMSNYAFSTGGVRFYMLDAAWGNSNTGTATGGPCGTNCAIYQVDHDAHWTPVSAESQWVKSDLAAHPGGLKFAFFHFPLYTDNATQTGDAYLDNTPGSIGSLEQLLHDNGVQLAFNGHAHIYQRNIATPGGVTSYVTGGGGGQAEPVNHCSTTDADAVGWSYSSSSGSACGAAAPPATDAQVYHFLKVTVNGTNVTVNPINSQGQSFDAQTYNFAPDSTPPSPPGHLTYTQLTTGGDQLAWTAATDNVGVTAYDIYRDGIYLATVGPGVTSYTDSAVTTSVRNTYQVAARDQAGNTTSDSVTTGGKPNSSPPTAPAKLAASAAGYTQASLSWGASSDKFAPVYSYTILRNGEAVATVPAPTTSYTNTGLTPGASYTYQVTAKDSAGNVSSPSNSVTITTQPDTPPTAPGTPTATSVTSSQAWISWTQATDNVGVTRYDVIRNGQVIASVSGTGYIDNSMSAGATYTYQVVAYNAAGQSAASGTLTVRTPQPGTLLSDGFETGDLSQWSTVSGLTIESTTPHSGTYGAEETSTGTPTYAYESLPGAYTELWAQTWVYVNSQSTSANLIGLRGSNGGSIINLYLSQTGKLSLRGNVGGGFTATSATTMPAGSWHRVVLHAIIGGTSGSVDVSTDGTAVTDLSLTGQNLGTNAITSLQLGETTTGRTYDIDFDDVAVAQSPL